MTVEELANQMHLTLNAVRNQLSKLQESNLVVRSGTRPGVSKPSAVYSITLEGHDLLTCAHRIPANNRARLIGRRADLIHEGDW